MLSITTLLKQKLTHYKIRNLYLGRMYRDQEMAALSSAGAGVGRLYIAVFKAIIPIALLSVWMALYASPWAADKVEQVIFEQKQSIGVRAIAAGKFSEYNQGQLIFYVESISADDVMHDVFVQSKSGNNAGIITAETAEV
jgi:lipopolysaccharide export system permease protein